MIGESLFRDFTHFVIASAEGTKQSLLGLLRCLTVSEAPPWPGRQGRRNDVGINFLFLLIFLMVLSFTTSSMAGQYDIKEMTPEVQAALDNRRGRFEELRQLKVKRIVGENNRGYVELLATDNKEAGALVDAENRDRKVVYTTVQKQNNLTNAMATIEKVFAQVQREKAQAGDKIQDEDGQWITK